MRIPAVLIAVFLLLSGCHRADPSWVRTDLYFGRDIPGDSGDEVSRDAFEAFVDDELVPWVGGMTITEASGRYERWDGGVGAERTFVVTILLTEADFSALWPRIDAAIQSYRDAFDQGSVLVTRSAAEASFVGEP